MSNKIYSIYPPIGIARVGGSGDGDVGRPEQEKYFIGPETPGFDFVPTGYDGTINGEGAGKYRDREGALRRHGARFRIYETTLDALGNVESVREITYNTPGIEKITWKVHLANKKAAAERFPPYYHDQWGHFGAMRNPGISEKHKLIVDSKAQRVPDSPTSNKKLSGKFLDSSVKLGDAFVEEDGQLVVLGGHGRIFDPKGNGLGNPAGLPQGLYNHDGICDDTSDGRITASVKFSGQAAIQIDQADRSAWVIVAPPNHAPAVQSVVTLYDVTFQANLAHLPTGDDRAFPSIVSFTRDIYPLLRRTVDFQYVSERARMGHSGQGLGNFFNSERFKLLSTEPFEPDHKRARQHFLNRLTTESARQQEIDMPFLYGGVYPESPRRKPQDWLQQRDRTSLDSFGKPLTVTPYQRRVLEKWADGFFAPDWPGSPPPHPKLEEIEELDRPHALVEAALEHCSGGSFHPGIEGPYLMARSDTYGHWFRVNSSLNPGDLTMGMSCPWHTDFVACSELWWPAQRPNSVPVLEGGSVTHQPWSRGSSLLSSYEDISQFGIVKYDSTEDKVIEQERVVKDS